RKGSLHTYHLRFSSDGAPTLTHARTFHLHHFHFPPPHPALPKPASVLALSPSHLLLVGLVAVVVPSSSSSSSSSSFTTTTQAQAQTQAQKLRPRIHAAVFDTALEAIVAESDITSALLPTHFSLPSSSSSSSSSSSAEHNPNGIPDVNFTISTLRSGSHHAVVLLNTLPPASQHKAARKSLTGAGGAPPARSSAALILPYTLPPRSALQHALGKAEPTARWIAPVSLLVPRAGGVNAAAALVSNGTATAGLQAGIKKRRGRKGKSHHNHDKKEEEEEQGHGTGQKTPTSAQGQQQQQQQQPLSLPELVAQAQWTQLAHAMRTRPGLAEDELVYALVRAFRSARLPLRDTVLKAFLRLPLSRPLVRAALKRHLRLPSSEGPGAGQGPGAGAGDEVVGAVVVLGDVLCAWVEEWAGVPLHLHPGSGWAPAAAADPDPDPDPDSHSRASSAPPTADLPQLDEIILLLTDLLDTFFPTLISASLSHPSVPAFLERTRAALETHARTLQALRVLVPPLNAFAALEADRVRAARAVLAAAEAAAEEEEEQEQEQEQGQAAEGRAHPALRGWWNNGLGGAKERPRPRPAHLNKSLHHRRSASQQQQQPGGQKSKKNKSSSSAAAIGPLEVAPRTATGGGGGAGVNHLQQQGPDAAGRTKRRMMQEASLLVGEYAVEVLEF
ncbi:hypothetical protein OC834_000695, partial [Tilletia horrida]